MLKEILKRYYYLIPAIVFALLYFQTIFYGSAWGDDPMVISAPAKDFKTMAQVFYDNSIYSGVHYFPLFYLQCFIVNMVFGEHAFPFGFHLYHYFSNILVCILATVLFFRVTGSKLISILIILLWVVHPVNVQNFTRLLVGPGVMAQAFCFTFLILYLNAKDSNNLKIKNANLLFANCFLLLSLLTSESFVFFPLILYLIFFVLIGKKIFSRDYFYLLYPLIIVFPLYFFLRTISCGGIFNNSVDTEFMQWTEFGTLKDVLFRAFWLAPQLLVHYFKLIFFPFGLIDSKAEWYKVGSSLFSTYSVFCQLAITVLILLALYLYKKIPLFLCGIVWFFISIALCIQIFPLFTITGIRYICIPMLGILLAIFSLFVHKKNFFSNKILIMLFIPIFIFLTLRTMYYLSSSRDFLHQWIYCAKEAPLWNKPQYLAKAIDTAWDEKRENELPSWLTEEVFEKAVYDWIDKYLIIKRDLSIEYGPMQMAYNFYAFRGVFKFLHIDGQLENLNHAINSSLQVNDSWLGWYEIARFLKQANQWKPAWKALKNAIQSNPKVKHSYDAQFIEVAIKAGVAHEANEILDKYILLASSSSHPYFVKAFFLSELGDTDGAKKYFLQASDPQKLLGAGEGDMYYFAGNFFMKYGMYEDAKKVLRLALTFDPFNEKIKSKLKEIEQQL
ncbi:MAG: hypothetical protein HYZ79_04415 [Candidatus Melainabacteria bacterium]|nr:hypothetical protein [Candidatus Melainabacteria bacterium]